MLPKLSTNLLDVLRGDSGAISGAASVLYQRLLLLQSSIISVPSLQVEGIQSELFD